MMILIAIIALLLILAIVVAMVAYGGDDINLKILILIMVILYTIAVVGVWEEAVKPIYNFFAHNVSINL